MLDINRGKVDKALEVVPVYNIVASRYTPRGNIDEERKQPRPQEFKDRPVVSNDPETGYFGNNKTSFKSFIR